MVAARPGGEAPAHGYEPRDLSVRAVGLFLLGLGAVTGLVLLLMAWMFGYFAARAARLDVPPSPLAGPRQLPPEPRLQVNPREDLKRAGAAEDAALNSYGWVDREGGRVRIPIERAMDLLVERRLPAPAPKARPR